jgi:hypothetical protein
MEACFLNDAQSKVAIYTQLPDGHFLVYCFSVKKILVFGGKVVLFRSIGIVFKLG